MPLQCLTRRISSISFTYECCNRDSITIPDSHKYLSPFRLTAFAYGSTLETTLGGIYTRVRNRRVLATLTGVAAPARRGSRANNMPVSAGSEHEASCCNAVVYCCRTAVRGAATGRYEASSPLTLTDLGILVSKAVVEVMDAST